MYICRIVAISDMEEEEGAGIAMTTCNAVQKTHMSFNLRSHNTYKNIVGRSTITHLPCKINAPKSESPLPMTVYFPDPANTPIQMTW